LTTLLRFCSNAASNLEDAMTRTLWRTIGFALGLSVLLGLGQPRAAAQTLTLTGEIIDPALYVREGRHGPEAELEMFDAMDGGQTLALLADDTNAVYLLITATPGDDPNELAYDYVAMRVRATGNVYERGGLKGIVLTSVEPLE